MAAYEHGLASLPVILSWGPFSFQQSTWPEKTDPAECWTDDTDRVRPSHSWSGLGGSMTCRLGIIGRESSDNLGRCMLLIPSGDKLRQISLHENPTSTKRPSLVIIHRTIPQSKREEPICNVPTDTAHIKTKKVGDTADRTRDPFNANEMSYH